MILHRVMKRHRPRSPPPCSPAGAYGNRLSTAHYRLLSQLLLRRRHGTCCLRTRRTAWHSRSGSLFPAAGGPDVTA